MMTKKKETTLHRADPRESILQSDIVIRFSVTTAIILTLILFVIICFLLVPATGGFYWW
jgi:fucose permease